MDFRPQISPDLRLMDARIFVAKPMGLSQQSVMSLSDRMRYDAANNILFINFEGLHLNTPEDVRDLSRYLDDTFRMLMRKVNVIVNYDNFNLSQNAADDFYAMVRYNTDHYFLSSMRYSTHAFFRRQIAAGLAGHRMPQHVYRSFEEARDGIA